MRNTVLRRPTVSGDLVLKHVQDVAGLALRLAAAVNAPASLLGALKTGALLHDVGKIGIPTPILEKPGPLNRSERAIVQQHVILGDELARQCDLGDDVRLVIRHHHERWDGAGYPDGLQGEKIPLLARIVAICDTCDAMTRSRVYHPRVSIPDAIVELTRCAGTQFDPYLVHAFITQVLHRR